MRKIYFFYLFKVMAFLWLSGQGNVFGQDLEVTDAQSLSGTYDNLTIKNGGKVTLTGELIVNAALTVETGGALDLGLHTLSGAGSLTFNSDATMAFGSSLSSAVTLTGTKNWGSETNFIVNGTTTQDLTGFPSKIRSLTLDNPEGMYLSAALEVKVSVTVLQGRLNLNNQQLRVWNVSGHELTFVNHSMADHNFTLRFQKADQIFNIQGTEMLNLSNVDSQQDRGKILLNNDVNLKADNRLEKGSHFDLNGHKLWLRSGFDGFSGYGAPNYFLSGNNGSLVQNLSTTSKSYVYNLITPNMVPELSSLGAKLKVNVSYTADAIEAGAYYKLTLVEGIHPAALGAITTDYLKKYVQIEFFNVTNPLANIEFSYLDADIAGDETVYELLSYQGSDWVPAEGSVVPAGNVVMATGIAQSGTVTAGRFLGLDIYPCPEPEHLSVSNVTFSQALLSWNVWAPEAIAEYTLQYRIAGTGDWNQVTGITESNYLLEGLTDNTSYEWQVSSACVEGFGALSGFSSPIAFTTQEDNGCMAPIGLGLASLSSGTADIVWQPVSGAIGYVLEYKEVQDMDWISMDVDGSQSGVSLSLTDESSYQVRVKTVCDGVESLNYSQELSFLSYIEGYEAATNSLYISTQRNIPTVITFNNIYIQSGGKATLTADLTVGNELKVMGGGALFCHNFLVQGSAFILEDNGHIGIGSPQGITKSADAGNIRTSVRIYSSNAVYEYNGQANQVPGDALGSNYAKLIVNSGYQLDMGTRPSFGSYVLINAGYLKSSLNYYLNKNTIIENHAGPDALALCPNVQTSADNLSITIKGSTPTRVNFHVDKHAVFDVYTDIVIDKFTSYQGSRGLIRMHGADLIFAPGSYSQFGVKEVFFDANSRFVQRVDATLVGNELVYNRFFDWQGNPSVYRLNLQSLDATDAEAALVFRAVPASHPERGGAMNFLKSYLDVATHQINAFSATIALNYLPSQVVGEESLMLGAFYNGSAWSYEGVTLNAAGQEIVAGNIQSAGQLTAGFDFSLAAQTCEVPSGLNTTHIDYQGAQVNWTAVENGVDLYRVRYRKTGEGEDAWIFMESAGATSLLLSGLQYDTSYDWQVQTVCLPGFYGESGVSEVAQFRTEPLKDCITPVGLLSDDITASGVILRWDEVAGAQKYTLQFREQGATAWNITDNLTSTSMEVNALDFSTAYEWRVRTGCGPGYYEQSDYQAESVVFTTTPDCALATDLRITDLFYYGVTLNWTPVADAVGQSVRYIAEGGSQWSYQDGLSGEDADWITGEVLDPQTFYQWQVRTYCANGGVSPFTPSAEFVTTAEPACKAVVDLASVVNTNQATMSWTTGESTASEQSWTLAFRKKGENEFVYQQVMTTQWEQSDLEEGTTYEWQVRTNCDGEGYPWKESEWTAMQEFTTWMTCDDTPTGLTTSVEGWCSALLSWDPIPGVTNYELRYREVGSADWVVKGAGNRNSSFFSKGVPSTTYEWQVRTYCHGTETNSEWSELAQFTTLPDDGVPCGAPTDNPYFTKYGHAPAWTDDLKWDNFVNLVDYDDGSGYWDNALLNAMIDIYMKGGGVVYCPAGEYHFRENVDVAPEVIIRGETPEVTDAKSADFAPPTRFVFPKYVPVLEGSGTDNTTAFKSITSGGTRSNTGLIYLDINRAAVKFNVDMAFKEGYSTSQPVGEKKNVILFGLRSNNVAAPDPNVPSADQNAWQRWSYRFAVNLSVYVTENGIITNNRVNDLGENNVHPIEDDSFEMPGYIVKDDTNFITLDGSQAKFNYTKHYGIELNRGKAYQTYGTYEVEPSLYAPGNEVVDNWLFTTGRVGIMASGTGLVIKGNIKKDHAGKVAWVDPTGMKLVSNSATLENRGIDFSGRDITISDNYLEVFNDNLKSGGYLSVDGEGILIQECCGGSPVRNVLIENNTIKGSNGYIGIYKMRDIDGLIIRNNDLSGALGMQSNHSIWVAADTNNGPYRADNVRIEGNITNKMVALRAASGACNTYIVNNTGTGSIEAPCNTVVANNTGLTYTGTPCAPEDGCDMQAPPQISSFDPTEGAEMFEVTLQGLQLTGTERILVGDAEVTDYEVLDDTSIRFRIPASAQTGKITVYTNKAYWNGSQYVYPASGISADDLVVGAGVAPLVLTPVPGYYDGPVTVTISTPTADAIIYYTLDGTEPGESATRYNEALEISESCELRARAYKDGIFPSLEASGLYMLQIIDADFSVGESYLGQPTSFTAGVLIPFGEVEKVEWDFNNDGVYDSEGLVVEYQFDSQGAHTVRMKVTTDLGFTREVEKGVTVLTTGLNRDVMAQEVVIWPVPAMDVVNVSIQGALPDGSVRYFITDLSGRLMHYNQVNIVSGESFSINVSSLKTGKYLVSFYLGDQMVVRPIMVK